MSDNEVKTVLFEQKDLGVQADSLLNKLIGSTPWLILLTFIDGEVIDYSPKSRMRSYVNINILQKSIVRLVLNKSYQQHIIQK